MSKGDYRTHKPKKWIPKRSGNPWEKYLAEFASAMASVMAKAMQKGGDRSSTPWTYDLDFLRDRLSNEFYEWEDLEGDAEAVESGELLDIANFCYFLWVRLNKKARGGEKE